MPKRIGNYELGRTIGRGKYSKVKFCIDVVNRKHYAIKIMSLKDIRRTKMETQLRREIAIMKMIQHRNIVRLVEVLQTTRNIYIVMHLVKGGELFDKIMTEERFKEEIGRKFFHQIVDGLAYCHSHGIAHRDLKPENLLVDNNGVVKITDFGLSTLANQNQKDQLLHTTCGTPNYVAPEVISQKGYNGFKADIWSLGVILFVMLAGYLPFEDKSIQRLFKKIEKGNYRCPSFFGKDLKELLSKMLCVSPEKRISIQNIRKHKWFAVDYEKPPQNISKPVNIHHPTADSIEAALQGADCTLDMGNVKTIMGNYFSVDFMLNHVLQNGLKEMSAKKKKKRKWSEKRDRK